MSSRKEKPRFTGNNKNWNPLYRSWCRLHWHIRNPAYANIEFATTALQYSTVYSRCVTLCDPPHNQINFEC